MKWAYYNEWEPYCAQWLRNLLDAGHIPAGEVDERNIREVSGDDLKGYGQCHLFAGIGGWAYAGRLAGIPDDEPIWTGSCPCQPLSSAGQRKGHADERHLWPAFQSLIAERRPATVFGEQVASKDGREWLAGVRADLENLGYAVGATDLPAASAGAPHIRQRLWWVADATGTTRQRDTRGISGTEAPGCSERQQHGDLLERPEHGGASVVDGLANATSPRQARAENTGTDSNDARQGPRGEQSERSSHVGGLGISNGTGSQPRKQAAEALGYGRAVEPASSNSGLGNPESGRQRTNRQNKQGAYQGPCGSSFWDAYDLIPCGDGKARRVEPGTFPLAHGVPARVGKLRAYGNAIVPQVAAEFMMAARAT